MAITYFGYSETATAIKAVIDAIDFRDDPDPTVLVEDHPEAIVQAGRTVIIRFDGRDDQQFQNQDIAAGQRKSLSASFLIEIYQQHIESTEAARLRNRMLEEIECALVGNRKLGGAVDDSDLGPVAQIIQRDESNYWAMCALRLDCLKTITSQ